MHTCGCSRVFENGYIADMFDVLVYVYEHYWRGDVCPELPLLGRKLSAAGFDAEEIQQALADYNEGKFGYLEE